MTSLAERLAGNVNMEVLSKAQELKKRIWFVILALVVYRIGTHIPLAGIDAHAIAQIFNKNQGGILGMFNMFAGGAVARMSIFALGIMPYISASIIMQLMTVVSPQLAEMKKEGESGRKKINQMTRYLTVILAMVQGYGIAVGLEGMGGQGGSAVLEPGLFFRLTTAVTLTGSTVFLMWLGEQITSRGIGNGISLIIFAGIVAEMPRAIVTTFEMGRSGALSAIVIIGVAILAIALVYFIVFMERAQRKVPIQYPKRQVGNKIYSGDSSHLPLKLNTAGVIPPIFASSILLFPLTIASFQAGTPAPWVTWITTHMAHGQPLYIAFYVLAIVFFAFFYTSIIFNPQDVADNLKKHGGFIQGIRPGANTAEHLDGILTRITFIGAAYIAFVCVIPEILISRYSIPFYLGGTSILIVVNVTIDTITQIQSHLFAHQYEGLIKKAKLKGRK